MTFDCIHQNCGQLIQVDSESDHLVCFRDAFGRLAMTCDHCQRRIVWEDLDSMQMFEILGVTSI